MTFFFLIPEPKRNKIPWQRKIRLVNIIDISCLSVLTVWWLLLLDAILCRYPRMSEEEIAQRCPVCLGNCNCKRCLRLDPGHGPQAQDEVSFPFSFHLIFIIFWLIFYLDHASYKFIWFSVVDFKSSEIEIWSSWKAYALEAFGSIAASIFEKAKWWTDEGIGVWGQETRHVWSFLCDAIIVFWNLLFFFWALNMVLVLLYTPP